MHHELASIQSKSLLKSNYGDDDGGGDDDNDDQPSG